MQVRHGAMALVCGLGAATGAGVWVMRGAEPQVLPVERPAVALAPEPVKPTPVPSREGWTPPSRPIVIAPEPAARGDPGDRGDRGAQARDAMMRQFDTDGDGELSDAERQAARAQWEARAGEGRQVMMRRYDKDGDGELSESERQAARAEIGQLRDQIRERIMPQYDLDGNGELNDQEREAAGPAFRAEYERIRTVATLDLDGSGDVDATELARAVLAVGDGDATMDLNRDGEVYYGDAAYATVVALGGT